RHDTPPFQTPSPISRHSSPAASERGKIRQRLSRVGLFHVLGALRRDGWSSSLAEKTMCIRSASIDDYEALCAIDSITKTSVERRDEIRSWLGSACCCVAEANGRVAAYGVLTHHFYGKPFIEMVMVGSEFRRQGLGEAIIRHFQSTITDSKLFSSTNMSNRPMQELFAKTGFKPSGYIDNLDDGDPEIIFYCPAV
ncbi:GNAT family N-acetyltransferase, partial [Pseudomonas aeruginosa]|uniref:GNAT family N-acetyltransferase n=1 Tax=Pseudomonas aeruginosa TaxID=287 RepID=UPI0030078233